MAIVWPVEAVLILSVGISASTDSVNSIFTVRMRNREMTRKRNMTAEEAIRKQNEIAEHFDLGFWYGVGCERCCGVFPKLIGGIGGALDLCRYECEVCGKTTNVYEMPWLAEEAWNKGLFVTGQGRLF